MRRTVITAILLASVLVAPTMAASTEESAVEHMEVEATDTCDGCHAEITPGIHADWYGSKHGLLNVKCFVCHGAVGEEFRLEPESDRCVGCHYEQVQSLSTEMMEGKTCFSCHPPHALGPHAADSEEGGTP